MIGLYGQDLVTSYAAIIYLIETPVAVIEKGKIAIGMDLNKEFDAVDRDIFISKLAFYGIRGIAHDLLQSYLNNRKQYGFHGEIDSEIYSAGCRVLQVSNNGPLLS